MIFGHLADITLEVDGDPDYRLPEGMQTVVSKDGVVKAGEQITVTVPELPIDELKEKYESGESNTIKTAELVFYTNIPGILKIGNEYNKYVSPDEGGVSTIEDIRSITFSIPEETPAGIYTIHGGFVDMLVTKGWMDYYPLEYRGMINDVTITVLPSDSQEVEALINAIGEVTLESENAIKTARGAYELLTEEQKPAVKNYQKLLDTEEAFDKLKAEEAEKLIDEIGKVNKDSEDKIKDARAAYDKLTENQKKLVSSDSVKKLEDAEAAYAKLVRENGPKTGDSMSVVIYALLLVAAAATGTVVYRKKKKA